MISVSKNLTNVDKKRQHISGQVTVQYKESKDLVLSFIPDLKKLVIKMTTKNNGRSGFYFVLFIWNQTLKYRCKFLNPYTRKVNTNTLPGKHGQWLRIYDEPFIIFKNNLSIKIIFTFSRDVVLF